MKNQPRRFNFGETKHDKETPIFDQLTVKRREQLKQMLHNRKIKNTDFINDFNLQELNDEIRRLTNEAKAARKRHNKYSRLMDLVQKSDREALRGRTEEGKALYNLTSDDVFEAFEYIFEQNRERDQESLKRDDVEKALLESKAKQYGDVNELDWNNIL